MQAVSVERACVLLSAVACLVVINGSGGGGGVIRLYRCCWDAFVMVVDYLFRVVQAAVTDFDGVSVKDFSEPVIFGKVLVYLGEEFVSDVGAGVLPKRRVVPVDVIALSVFPFGCFGWFVL